MKHWMEMRVGRGKPAVKENSSRGKNLGKIIYRYR